jgi:hypothetical protein
MARLIVVCVVLAAGAGLAGCGSSPFSRAPAAQVAPTRSTSPYAIPGSTQSQYECVTDEGDGRFLPCGARSF